MSNERLEQLRADLEPARRALLRHPIYNSVDSIERLRPFMETHVYAVWDFMSLAKRLQRDLTGVGVPWFPPIRPELARFVNEVVLGEESDLGPDRRPTSHLELYLDAMEEISCDTRPFRRFLELMRRGSSLEAAALAGGIPQGAYAFMQGTLQVARSSSTVAVAAEFLFGREDLIPDMFQRLLTLWPGGDADVPIFAYYLRRHIELDGDEHGPLAERLLTTLAESSPGGWERATRAAERALTRRLRLWDSVI